MVVKLTEQFPKHPNIFKLYTGELWGNEFKWIAEVVLFYLFIFTAVGTESKCNIH